MNTSEMPRYVCHKVVHALKVRTGPRHLTQEYVTLTPEDERFAPIRVTTSWILEKHVGSIGYYVVYEDGYASWSPVEAFEKGYTRAYDPAKDQPARLSSSSPWRTTMQALVDALGKYAAKDISPEVRVALAYANELLKDGVSLTCRPIDPLEAALIDISNARDGAGLHIRLLPSTNYRSAELRRVTNEFMHINFDHIEFFGRDSSEKTRSMAAWYRNLALLARATAEAIDFDMRRHGV